MLFGSYARGEARPDSDIDIIVVLKGTVNPGHEVTKVSDFVADLSLEYDKVISCFLMDEDRFINRQGPLLRNIRREGISVTWCIAARRQRRALKAMHPMVATNI
jgi:predicted nucleotidyltransferase